MPLEDPNSIDMVIGGPDAPVLVITDAGLADGDDRSRMLKAKLQTYAKYVETDEFRSKHEGADSVRIRVMCRVPPTPEMSAIGQVAGPSGRRVPVDFETFPGSP